MTVENTHATHRRRARLSAGGAVVDSGAVGLIKKNKRGRKIEYQPNEWAPQPVLLDAAITPQSGVGGNTLFSRYGLLIGEA